MRHEFLCPEFESKGICKKKTRCPYTHKDKSKKQGIPIQTPIQHSKQDNHVPEQARYFLEEQPGTAKEQESHELSADGAIKLSRVLNKLEKVKANYKFSTGILTENGGASFSTDNISNNLPADSNQCIAKSEKLCDGNEDDDIQILIPSRPKLGKLPSYIPIG